MVYNAWATKECRRVKMSMWSAESTCAQHCCRSFRPIGAMFTMGPHHWNILCITNKRKKIPFALPNIAAHKLQNFPTPPLQDFPSQCGSVSGCLAKNPALQAPPFPCLIHPIRLLLPPRNIRITNKPICVFSSFSCHFINPPLCIWMRERPRRRVCASLVERPCRTLLSAVFVHRIAEISVRVSVRIRLCTLFPWRYIMKAVFHHVFMWLHRTAECLDRSQPLSVCVWKPAIMSPGWRSDGVFRVGLNGWIWIVSQMSSWINTAIYFKLQSDCTLNCLLFCFPPPAVSLIVISASYPPLAA